VAKFPEHLTQMIDRCKDNELLELTAACGCRVYTAEYEGEKLPVIHACDKHRGDVMASASYVGELGSVDDKPEYLN